jgi:hypothetical protein
MEMISGIAVANWKNEQLEISKWFRSTDEKKMCKELQQLLVKVYLKCVQKHATGDDSSDIRNADMAFGTANSEDPKKIPADKVTKIHYVFAKGRYLDPKKRSYFSPEKIILEGDVDMDEL